MDKKISNRDVDADIMRIVAAFFVVVIHAAASHPYSLSSVIFNSIARFSVPVFVMISGRYMLAKKPVLRSLLIRCFRLFAIMLVWAAVYYIYDIVTGVKAYGGVKELLVNLLTEPVHLWYIYAIIALYIFTPCFYTFCSNASRQDMIYALVLTFFFGSVIYIIMQTSHFAIIKTIIDKMKLDCTLGFVFCYLLGNFWQKYECGKRARIFIYVLGLLGTAATIVGTLILSGNGTAVNYVLFSFFAPNVLVAGMAFYLFIIQFGRRHDMRNIRARAAIHSLAACTLGIYLLHVLILRIITGYFTGFADASAIPLETLTAFILSALCIFVIRKVPFLKMLV